MMNLKAEEQQISKQITKSGNLNWDEPMIGTMGLPPIILTPSAITFQYPTHQKIVTTMDPLVTQNRMDI